MTDNIKKIKTISTKPKQSNFPQRLMKLPVVPLKEGILFPVTESVLAFGRDISLNGLKIATKNPKKLVVLLAQKKSTTTKPTSKDLYTIGTLAVVERTIKTEDTLNALVRGIGRIRVQQFTKEAPYLEAQVTRISDLEYTDNETKALANHLQKSFRKTIQMGKPVEFLNFMKLLGGVKAGELADQIASTLNLSTEVKQSILETIDVKRRLQIVSDHLSREIKILEIEKDVVHKTQKKFDKHMRENILRERLRTIQKELGEIDDEDEITDSYFIKLKKLKVDADIKKKVKKEIKRLSQMSANNPETGYIRSWLDIVFELPWGKTTKGKVDLKKAGKILDIHHYGLQDVKDRVLEHIAVLQLQQKNKKKSLSSTPTILCFAGPPGVGKTSIGKSIAEALNRKFIKASLGGIRDEAEIRGHRKTYVGAMTGKIIAGIKQAQSMNPVFMLDEIDKLGNDFRGDPSAALLEVLDPEQNKEFVDHYLDIPFDLSQTIFITTANSLDTIPPALRDRLEIIHYSGYTPEEKFNIAQKHLLTKVIEANGLEKSNIEIPATVIEAIIASYTREAGVRNLERTLHTLSRKAAKELVLHPRKKKISITTKNLKKLLGPKKYDEGLAEKRNMIGAATGLAWTSVGGDVLFVEVALTPGKGKIQLTGQLGDVMKESAQAAFTYVKSNLKSLKIPFSKVQKTDIHIHVPEGAVPKDGPSAGVTLSTAIVSALTKIPVKRTVAMTGETTLRGKVLRIGGLKEKTIAAHRAGITTVIIPKENKRDLEKIPDSVKKAITFKPVSSIKEVLEIALTKAI